MIKFQEELEYLDEIKQTRFLSTPQGIDFSSNDYLGISQSNILKESILNYINSEKYLWHTSSRLISGTTEYHLESEKKLARFLGRESSLIFSSGYCANSGVISTLCKDSIIFSDEYNHTSLIEGIKLSQSECRIYAHNNLDHLESHLKEYPRDKRKKYIVTESIFSMDGSITNLETLSYLCQKYQAFLILDEAHSTGLYGKYGRGLFDGHKFINNELITIHTGGKALGAYGAFIGCSSIIKKYLINKCRHFIYTTALPPINIFILIKSIEFVSKADHYRNKLFRNIKDLHNFLGINEKLSPIVPIYFPGNENILNASKHLTSGGISIKAIRSPTVPTGTERLRVSVHAHHTKDDIKKLLGLLSDVTNSKSHMRVTR